MARSILTTTMGEIFLLLLLAVDSCLAITLKDVGVPAYAVKGKSAVLSCDYDLEGVELYSLKWYKNGKEFYRYIPKNEDPFTIYKRPGLNVDKRHSDDHQVALTQLNEDSTGRYRCEVSTEGPSFATVSHFGDMVIVVPPKEPPTIEGGRLRYRLGDEVNVTCLSRDSKPAANLVWYINGKRADDPSYVIPYPILNGTRDGLYTSRLGLSFKVSPRHFGNNADMKLKCTASIGSTYLRSNEKSAEGVKHKRDSSGMLSRRQQQHLQDSDLASSMFSSGGPSLQIQLEALFVAATLFQLLPVWGLQQQRWRPR